MSRNNFPKQFIDILGTGKTLIRKTYERFLSVCPPENIYIVTNESYLPHVFSQIPELDKHQVLAEPQRRNTSPCVAYAASKIFSKIRLEPATPGSVVSRRRCNTPKSLLEIP